jgi:fructoselysine-6-P-deglycase FrlB-like protein
MNFKTTIFISAFLVSFFFLSCKQEKAESNSTNNETDEVLDKEIEEISETLETDAKALEKELKELDNF